MKRKAEHALDRDDFLRDDDETAPQTTQGTVQNTMATPEQIAQRRIVKLKIPGQTGEQTELSSTAKFELAGALDQSKPATTGNNGSNAQTPSFLANLPPTNTTASTGGLFSNIIKPTEGGEEKKGGLFSGLFNKDNNQTATSGLFSTSQTGSGGLFGSIFGGNAGGGLASLAKKDYTYVHNETGEKEKEKEGEKKEGAAQAKPAQSKPSLFASLADFKPGPNLFSSTASSGLFSSNLTGGSGAFGGLFGGANKGGDDGSDDGGEDGDDEPQPPSPEADVTKSKGNYEYKLDYEKVIGKKVNKFKPGAKEMLLEGEVSLNKRNESGNYFVAYRNKAKVLQYQGELVAKVSKTEFLNPRQDALSIVTFSVPTAEEGKEAGADKPKIVRDIVKLMFATADDCNEFKKQIDQVVA